MNADDEEKGMIQSAGLPASKEESRLAAITKILALGAAFWIPVIVYFLDGAAYFGILNVLNVHLEQVMGLGDAAAHFRTASLSAGLTLAGFLLGGRVDKWGPRTTITLALVLGVAGRVLLAAAPTFATVSGKGFLAASMVALTLDFVFVLPRSRTAGTAFAIATGFVGVWGMSAPVRGHVAGAAIWLGLALMAVSVGTLVPAVYATAKRTVGKGPAAALAFSILYALMNGGQVAEGFASSPVRAYFGTTGVVWMCAGIAALALAVHVLFYPRCDDKIEHAHRDYDAPAIRSLPRHPLRDPRFTFFIFALLGVRTLMAHQWLTLPQYVLRAYPAEVGAHFEWVSGLNPLICLVGTPLVALLTSRVHVAKMMILGTLVTAGATLLLVPGPAVWALLTYQLVFAVGECLWSSRFLEYAADIAPEGQVGLYQGVAQLPWFIAKFTTGLYSGHMLAAFCPANGPLRTEILWAVYAAIGLTSPVALLVANRWLRGGKISGPR